MIEPAELVFGVFIENHRRFARLGLTPSRRHDDRRFIARFA